MEYFQELKEFRLLCCRVCRACVTVKRVRAHLKGAPHYLTRQEIRKAVQWADELDVIRDDEELLTLRMPDADHEPIGALKPPEEGGRRCTFEPGCQFVGSSTKKCLHHLRSVHDTDPGVGAGRKRKGSTEDDMPWRTGVYYQRFFIRGLRSDYFEVGRGRNLEAERRNEVFQQKSLDEIARVLGGKGAWVLES
ncbi:hypothetical protein CMUS01_16108 [Colletotrichum musicola]|uniref:Uncharacterized protein n=1 Tax=Colletotrichum musicola TaxID=2175873 RepID=A0A8H6MKP1_9PEZI|nr:hypothetical protein CMUS01_16108 [Colletotrichum musicola]